MVSDYYAGAGREKQLIVFHSIDHAVKAIPRLARYKKYLSSVLP